MADRAFVNIGIIGTGFARSTQIPAFLACEGARVVAIASGHRENAETVAKQFGIEHATANWREIIDRDDIDLVSIVTPPFTHLEMSVAALEAGKAVLCEKPTAMNGKESAVMLAKARETGRLALIDHELRFHPLRRRMREIIANGEIGTVQHCKLHYRAASRLSPARSWDWWSDIERGGGALGAIGSHAVDAVRWITGAEFDEVFCTLAAHVKARPDRETGELKPVTADDEANIIMQLSDSAAARDATGTMSMSVVEAGRPEHVLEVFGSDGALRIESGNRLLHAEAGDRIWNEIGTDAASLAPGMQRNEWSEGFTIFAREIVDALREGRTYIENAATFEDGHRNQLVLDAARRSNDTGCLAEVESN
jgi:predicted dehydrogenase